MMMEAFEKVDEESYNSTNCCLVMQVARTINPDADIFNATEIVSENFNADAEEVRSIFLGVVSIERVGKEGKERALKLARFILRHHLGWNEYSDIVTSVARYISEN